jgi:hypothetical protein
MSDATCVRLLRIVASVFSDPQHEVVGDCDPSTRYVKHVLHIAFSV